jgi:hypothetical protein
MKAIMPYTRSRMFRRWLAIATLCAGASACDMGLESRTRPSEAMLSSADLSSVRSVQTAAAAPASGLSGACAEIEGVIAQLQVIGAGRLRFSGTGQLDLDERAWSRLPGAQRDMLLRALAAQNRCKTGASKGAGVVRTAQGARVIDRYREP